jgi:hypothetical protein
MIIVVLPVKAVTRESETSQTCGTANFNRENWIIEYTSMKKDNARWADNDYYIL